MPLPIANAQTTYYASLCLLLCVSILLLIFLWKYIIKTKCTQANDLDLGQRILHRIGSISI